MTSVRCFAGLLFVSVVSVAGVKARAVDVEVEVTASGGSTSNLFSDSAARRDTYSATSLDLNYYPLAFARVNLVSEYTYYGRYFRLSNLRYGGGLTLIPTPDSSRLSAYLEGNFSNREYRKSGSSSNALNPNEFTGNEYDATAGLDYHLGPRTQLRASATFHATEFPIEGVIDREKYDFASGGSTTLFGRYGLDVEAGYSTGKYQFINPIKYVNGDPSLPVPRLSILPGEQYSILLEDNLKSVYVSSRVSTSFGKKTGVGLTYSVRHFLDRDESATIYGYSTGYLSPWLNDYEGQAVVLKLKTFLIPRLITSLTCGFWERRHLRTVELELIENRFHQIEPDINLLYAQERTDWRRRVDLKVQWPLVRGNGLTFEPSLQVGYTDNNSSVLVYDYTDFSLSGGVTIRF